MNQTITGILGGVFDPVHLAHTWCAEAVLNALQLKKIEFIPCFEPVHKARPVASVAHRLRMLELALHDHPHCHINTIEIDLAKPSYFYQTIQHLDMSSGPYALILGYDAWQHFYEWEHADVILSHLNLIVINRTGYHWPNQPRTIPYGKVCRTPQQLQQNNSGQILFHSLDFPDIFSEELSSSMIRDRLMHHQNVEHMLDPQVLNYIQTHQLYQKST